MRAKRFKNIDYGFRPESYDLPANPLQAILGDVQGTARKAIIRYLEARGQLSDLPAAQLQQLLDGQRCDPSAAIHPTFMGGEYLPAALPGFWLSLHQERRYSSMRIPPTAANDGYRSLPIHWENLKF